MLCIFDQHRPLTELERIIGDCGVIEHAQSSPLGKLDVLELLNKSGQWAAAIVAAHVAGKGGLLKTLKGQARVSTWQCDDLLACALPGSVKDAPDDIRNILLNKDGEHKRERPVSIINAQDISGPDDVAKPGSTCWIKMSEVSVEGLRQAFLDSDSRIRLASDPQPDDHAELTTLQWNGGFLDGASVHFNSNLNVLVGGRGTGKSTVIESLRYVLGLNPMGSDATNAHNDIVKHVLRSGTKVSLTVSSHHPARRQYRIERTVPNPPIVRNEQGDVLQITPADIIPRVELFGQHEISELTKPGAAKTQLLDRFMEEDNSLNRRKTQIKRELGKSHLRILELMKDISTAEEQLNRLPGLEETLKRFKDAGIEDQLKDRSDIVKEERIRSMVAERIEPFRQLLDSLGDELPIDVVFLSDKSMAGLPGGVILKKYSRVLGDLSAGINDLVSEIGKAIQVAEKKNLEIEKEWLVRKHAVQQRYEKTLRTLQKANIDGEEFIRLRTQIEHLEPLKERLTASRAALNDLWQKRRSLLAEWQDVKAEYFRRLDTAARRVSRKLKGRVRVEVTDAGNRGPLERLLRECVGGQLAQTIDRLNQLDHLSLTQFADICRQGSERLAEVYGLTKTQAKHISDAGEDLFLNIEALELPPTTTLKLNVGAAGAEPVWRPLEALSTGQKATAILLLLLLESDAPLIVDQPEDDLDNRFITDAIVPKMREEKRRRQFIFATHNANVPVLGDAELILGLVAGEDTEQHRARIPEQLMGSIDSRTVREMVEEVLEGGKAAFEMRRLKYGF